ncbi:cytochrome c family protein [Paracoccus sp. p3-h83]|uniref:c-type cytochrome n=1 Tax=Paracoccus sp. p3-h83 TaxID=3342805 RepID=UPI0035B7E696
MERLLGLLTFALYIGTGLLALFNVSNLIAYVMNKPAIAQVATTAAPAPEGMAATTAPTPAAVPAAAPEAAPVAVAAGTPAATPAAAPAGLDPAAGEKVFAKCKACHDAKPDGKSKTGPNLWNIVGRAPHAAEGFKYSDAMLADTEAWTPEQLDAYLADPKKSIPGNKMAFAGIKDAGDRHNLIAWLAQQADTPIAPEALPFAAATGAAAPAAEAPAAETAAAEPAAADPAAEPVAEPVADAPAPVYVDPPALTEAQQAEIDARVAALTEAVKGMDYERARHHPLHYPPQIAQASDQECLVCHAEILDHKLRDESPAGLKTDSTIAWYQTLATYDGAQADFHSRHMTSDFAQATMNLTCNFCHKGNDVREETPDMMPNRAAFSADPAQPEFTLRKMVNPETTCLRCHGAMPDPENIMGLAGPWHEIRADMEDVTSDDPLLANGCLSCHKDLFRTNRHAVTYLKAATIEDLAEAGSDTCYGCHGGRQWYRISYPYPRHPWPGMDPAVPDWAKDRPTASDPEYALPAAAAN